jgi:hypothetical protein
MSNLPYVFDDTLQTMIDWDAILPMSRYAGGHDEQMQGLIKGATVLGHWNEGDYQGQVATAMHLPDGRVALYNDYYGSCSGCDSWEDASDDDVRKMCIGLANGAYVFPNAEAAIAWLREAAANTDENRKDDGGWYSFSWREMNCAKGLLGDIDKRLSESINSSKETAEK